MTIEGFFLYDPSLILGIAMEWESQFDVCQTFGQAARESRDSRDAPGTGNRKEKEEAAMVARWLPSGKHTKKHQKTIENGHL